ncbi:MAG TPA: hypothetical protein VLL08_19260 [Kineosporiaceae bacterium]|nr:hypothetical protein [Kineosporiaceae bacterium]
MRRFVAIPVVFLFVAPAALAGSAAAQSDPARSPALTAAAARTCDRERNGDDFNGDNFSDVVIGDPAATRSGRKKAGVVQVRYGVNDRATGATSILAQGQARIGGSAETGDGFGAVIAMGWVDDDGCADVVISAPGENLGSTKDAGVVHVVFGSTAGLGRGKASLVLHAGSAALPGKPASGERFGSALEFLQPSADASEPASLAIGVPLRNVAGVLDAGAVDLVTFGAGGAVRAARTITQSSPAVPGTPQRSDRFGAAIAGGSFTKGCEDNKWCLDLMVGVPGKHRGAGAVVALNNPGAGSPYTGSRTWTENSPGVKGSSERGDGFGSSFGFDLESFTGQSYLAIGAPGEDLGSVKDAGEVHLFRGGMKDDYLISQNTSGVAGVAGAGDRFGEKLLITGYYTNQYGMALVVSAPYEDVAGHKDAGTVAAFHIASGIVFGSSDRLISQNSPRVPGSAAAGEHFGSALGEVASGLLVGVPDDTHWTGGAVLRIPWMIIDGVQGSKKFASKSLTRSGGVRFGAAIAAV